MCCHQTSRCAPPFSMMQFSRLRILSLMSLLALCVAAVGCSRQPGPGVGTSEVAPLGVGDPAPPLNLDQWVNGQPVTAGFEGGVHVVEFWATWCGPCRVSMPHISSLQEEYGEEVTFIGVTNEDIGTVEAFLASESPDGRPWSEVINYRLVTDNNDATNIAYMQAANESGIPTAFIVGRDATIKWIGHPGRIDEPLRQVVEGT